MTGSGGKLYGDGCRVTLLKLLCKSFPALPALWSVIVPVHLLAWDGCLGVGDVEGRTCQHLIVAVVARARGGHLVSPAGDGQGWALGGHGGGVTVLLYN